MALIHVSLEAYPEPGILEVEIPHDWYAKSFEELLVYIFTQMSHVTTGDSESVISVIYNKE